MTLQIQFSWPFPDAVVDKDKCIQPKNISIITLVMLQMQWSLCVGVGRLGCRRGTSGVPGRCSIGPAGGDTYAARSCWHSWLARTHRIALLTWGGYFIVVVIIGHTVQYSTFLYICTDSCLSRMTLDSCFAHKWVCSHKGEYQRNYDMLWMILDDIRYIYLPDIPH